MIRSGTQGGLGYSPNLEAVSMIIQKHFRQGSQAVGRVKIVEALMPVE
jgi:hypothetical protein